MRIQGRKGSVVPSERTAGCEGYSTFVSAVNAAIGFILAIYFVAIRCEHRHG